MGEFAKRAAVVLDDDKAWEHRLADQEQRLHEHVPSSKDEAMAKATQTIASLKQLAFTLGNTLRGGHHKGDAQQLFERDEASMGVPGREILIDLPATKQGWFDPLLRSKAAFLESVTKPLGHVYEDAKEELALAADKKQEELTKVTTDPATHPLYYPAMAMTVPKAFIDGYQKADTDAADRADTEMGGKLDQAKQDFEQALSEEYNERRKIGSAGELIDGLAEKMLEKSAEGEFNKALGVYLAVAALMGQGAHQATKGWVESRDPRRQKVKAVRELIQRRQYMHPPTVLVEPARDPAEFKPSPTLSAPTKEAGFLSETLRGLLGAAGKGVTAALPGQQLKNLAQTPVSGVASALTHGSGAPAQATGMEAMRLAAEQRRAASLASKAKQQTLIQKNRSLVGSGRW